MAHLDTNWMSHPNGATATTPGLFLNKTETHPLPPSLLPRQLSGKESEKVKVKVKSCPTLCDPMDCSLPGFSVHGIFQAGALHW